MPNTVTFPELTKLYCSRQECDPDSLERRLQEVAKSYSPDGFMLLECHVFDSSMFGSLVILPYGGGSTFKEPPTHPISPRGLASDMSVVIATMPASELSKERAS